MWLFLAFLIVPLIEIGLFIQVGGVIGLWPTLAIVITTAVLGTMLVRQQGLRAMGELRGSMQELRDPTEPLAHGAMILFSAALLLTPGFFTDGVGFALLLPPVRRAVIREVGKRIQVVEARRRHPRPDSRGDILEGQFEEVQPPGPKPGQDGASGWTRE